MTGAAAPAIAADLARIVGAANVEVRPAALVPYRTDATFGFSGTPWAVARPGGVDEVSRILAWANGRGVPVVPRGAGTSLAAGAVPIRGGIVLALTRMNRILSIDPVDLTAVAQPGVTTQELARAAGAHGLHYPPDPGSQRVSTLGGNVATNAGGLHGLKYGNTGGYVLGVQAVLAGGEVIRAGGRLLKDVAGYDLVRLLTGSEGTLAVLTELTLALRPAPAASTTGLAYFADLESAGDAVRGVVGAGILPATLEFLDASCIRSVEAYANLGLDTTAGAMLLFGDDGSDAEVQRTVPAMAAVMREHAASSVQVATAAAESQALLAARRCALPALSRLGGATVLEDVGVPRSRLPELVRRIDAIAARHKVTMATFGHAGDGNAHPVGCFDPRDAGQRARVAAAFDDVFAAAVELGGTITGEHGIGAAKLPYLEAQLGRPQTALLARIKRAFDPAGILNPGKLGS
ncbi:FAD-linked oxidase C-terminal domain-containing protein [Dactylosporangium sp. AC04546]|uniref:FAD-binding oxidoreductase n=1 Tax=Dactylosporangium sp. AC04546 TaxID=2862460 RepID=UPI001EDEAEC0|nr:FAD-linked oxidase C-terminal domain-containing protein [Dactylosporangium sp. AC04546]WVK89683.1 FAD-linked oxidase C-terminal domain-containing protein [Dactylosporangium sp. AC04546]